VGWALSSINTPGNVARRNMQQTEAASKITGDVLANRQAGQNLQRDGLDLATQFSSDTAGMPPENVNAYQKKFGSPLPTTPTGAPIPTGLPSQFSNIPRGGTALIRTPGQPPVTIPGQPFPTPAPRVSPDWVSQVEARKAELRKIHPTWNEQHLDDRAQRDIISARVRSSRIQPATARQSNRSAVDRAGDILLDDNATPQQKANAREALKALRPSMANLATGGNELTDEAAPGNDLTAKASPQESQILDRAQELVNTEGMEPAEALNRAREEMAP
jgi:hypothetical protein